MVTEISKTTDFVGLSTDTKPLGYANGSTFYCMDNGVEWKRDADDEVWVKQVFGDGVTAVYENSITYDLDGGVLASTAPTFYDTETASFTLTAPTKEEHTFKGWTGTDLTGVQTTVTIVGGTDTNNKEYTATYIRDYNIILDVAGGVAGGSNPTSFNEDDSDITLTNPTYTGYTFAGWTGTGLETATETVVIDTADEETKVFTATWTPIEYTIGYTLDSGTVEEDNPTTYTIESDAITLNNPTKDLYTFAGWTGTDLAEATETVTIASGGTGNREYVATYTLI